MAAFRQYYLCRKRPAHSRKWHALSRSVSDGLSIYIVNNNQEKSSTNFAQGNITFQEEERDESLLSHSLWHSFLPTLYDAMLYIYTVLAFRFGVFCLQFGIWCRQPWQKASQSSVCLPKKLFYFLSLQFYPFFEVLIQSGSSPKLNAINRFMSKVDTK